MIDHPIISALILIGVWAAVMWGLRHTPAQRVAHRDLDTIHRHQHAMNRLGGRR